MAEADPYHAYKRYHMADKMSERGGVSPLCRKAAGKPPKAINLRRELWTLRAAAVTCKKCLAALAAGVDNPTEGG